mgnify:CR=1 FL=1
MNEEEMTGESSSSGKIAEEISEMKAQVEGSRPSRAAANLTCAASALAATLCGMTFGVTGASELFVLEMAAMTAILATAAVQFAHSFTVPLGPITCELAAICAKHELARGAALLLTASVCGAAVSAIDNIVLDIAATCAVLNCALELLELPRACTRKMLYRVREASKIR